MMMKQMKAETDHIICKPKQAAPSLPPPLLPLPRFWVQKTTRSSVINREIVKFWRQKHIEEEDHLLAAIKAAARFRARNLSEEDYSLFVASMDDEDSNTKEKVTAINNNSKMDERNNEIRVGIKDW